MVRIHEDNRIPNHRKFILAIPPVTYCKIMEIYVMEDNRTSISLKIIIKLSKDFFRIRDKQDIIIFNK